MRLDKAMLRATLPRDRRSEVGHDLARDPGASQDDYGARGLQIALALAAWLVLLVGTLLGPWSAVLLPFVSVLPAILVADALGPHPYACRSDLSRLRRLKVPLAATALIVIGAALAVSLSQRQPLTDQPPTLMCAARDVLAGVDPYATFEPQCVASIGWSSTDLTEVATGAFAKLQTNPSGPAVVRTEVSDQLSGSGSGFPPFGYPPLAALLLLPVAYAGWLVVGLWVLAGMALLLWLTWRGPKPRGWVALVLCELLALGATAVVLRQGLNPEFISYLCIGLAFGWIGRAKTSALALAAAVLTNQLAWIAVPVYLGIVAKEEGFLRRLAWMVGGLVLGAVPWLIWDHRLPAELWRFLTLPYFPGGLSLGSFAPMSVVHTHVFLVGLAVGAIACGVVAWRSPEWRWSMAGIVWLSFMLGERGLTYYFVPMFWLSPLILLGAWRLQQGRWRTSP